MNQRTIANLVSLERSASKATEEFFETCILNFELLAVKNIIYFLLVKKFLFAAERKRQFGFFKKYESTHHCEFGLFGKICFNSN
jgi:uncharacterized membrane protein